MCGRSPSRATASPRPTPRTSSRRSSRAPTSSWADSGTTTHPSLDRPAHPPARLDRLRAGKREHVTDELPEVAEADPTLERLAEAMDVRAALAGLRRTAGRSSTASSRATRATDHRHELGIPSGTIASRISRCLARLREVLREESPASAASWRAVTDERFDEERLAELFALLPPAPSGWVEAARSSRSRGSSSTDRRAGRGGCSVPRAGARRPRSGAGRGRGGRAPGRRRVAAAAPPREMTWPARAQARNPTCSPARSTRSGRGGRRAARGGLAGGARPRATRRRRRASSRWRPTRARSGRAGGAAARA